MRKLAVPAALVLLLSATSPAFAGVGIPQIASVKIGTFQANVYNSSPGLRTGANTFTVEIPNLDHGSSVTLQLTGLDGKVVKVPLKTLTVLSGTEEAHEDEESHDTQEPTKTDDHSKQAAGHGSESADHGAGAVTVEAPGDDGHEEEAHGGAGVDTSAHLVRGTARLNATGDWKAVLEITDAHGEKLSASFPLHAEQGGPNRIFASVSGLLMGGSILYGMVQRIRQTKKGGTH